MQLERKYIREEERKAEEEMVGQCQTCAPHEKAFSILRINFRIMQSFSVV